MEELPRGCAVVKHGPKPSLLLCGNLPNHVFSCLRCGDPHSGGLGVVPLPLEPWGRIAWAFCGPLLVSSTGDAGCTENVSRMSQCRLM